MDVADAVKAADVMMLASRTRRRRPSYETDIAPNLRPGQLLLFAHGFNIRFGRIVPPDFIDVGMVAPKGPGHLVRSVYRDGGGVPALFAVERDASGTARARVLAYADALGCTRAGILETTFTEETETDLFGEQAVLCGGTAALVKAAFETLVEAGYQPELAYFETMHELKLIVDLMYRGGLNFMRFSVSDTAEYGDYVSGPRIIDDHVRATMKQVLTEIQDGTFAARWIDENDSGRADFERMRQEDADHQIERVGAELRSQMAFLDPVVVTAGQAQASARGKRGSMSAPTYGPGVPAGSVRIFDTTLRDGEQAPGAGLTVAEKLQVARQLVRLKVDVIEAGFPAASPGDFEAVRRIAEESKGVVGRGARPLPRRRPAARRRGDRRRGAARTSTCSSRRATSTSSTSSG